MASSKSNRRGRRVRSARSNQFPHRKIKLVPLPTDPEQFVRNLTDEQRETLRYYYALAYARVLKEVRQAQKLTPEQAALKVGRTVEWWRRRERGDQSPYIDEILYLATKLPVDTLWLFERLVEYRKEEEQKHQQ